MSSEITEEKYNRDYAALKLYLLLKSLARSNISQELTDELEKLAIPAFSETLDLTNVLDYHIFYGEFKIIFEAKHKNMFEKSEIECAEFLLSRCVILCSEPTNFSFLLVAAFLCHLIIRYYNEYECYRIFYIAEFCFDVLYGRHFSTVFTSKEAFENLELFCHECKKSLKPNGTVNEWRNTIGACWTEIVQKCVDVTDDNFSLTEAEIRVFTELYSVESSMEVEESSGESQETMTGDNDFEASKYYHYDCRTCGSKCYNYLNNLNFF